MHKEMQQNENSSLFRGCLKVIKYADYTISALLRKVRNSAKNPTADTATVVPEQTAVIN